MRPARTGAYRCVPTDIGNITPVLEDGISKFGTIDAVLMNYNFDESQTSQALDDYVSALTNVSEAAKPFLMDTDGQLLILGQEAGEQTMDGALQTVARNASRTLFNALALDWADDPVRIKLIEPSSAEEPKPLARRITHALNGVPQNTPVIDPVRVAQ